MASHYHNHLTLLKYRVIQSGGAPMFKIPVNNGLEPPIQWTNVSFSQFFAHVNTVAHFLMSWLQEKGIPPRSTIGVWLSGTDYDHFVYIIALSRVSYIPQMFSHSLTSIDIVAELMKKGGAKAIIYDPPLGSLMDNFPGVKLQTIPIHDCPKISDNSGLPDLASLSSEEAACFIYHTSGSTSGSPKLVPLTHKYIRTIYPKSSQTWAQGDSSNTQDVLTQIGSVSHVATMMQYLGAVHQGACIVQPSTPRFSATELYNMVKVCGLNRLNLFGVFLSLHIKAARQDSKILKILQGMRSVAHGGAPLLPEDEDWGYENHIPLLNIYANTECGLLMASVLGQHPRFLRPLPVGSYALEPVGKTTQIDNPDSIQFYEFVVLKNSPDLPQPHLLSKDGTFRTGDLFEKTENGYYVFRGRDDDWIKNDATRRCDTKAIEEQLRELCSDLIKDCVVVGNGRPSPALFIEKIDSAPDNLTDGNLKDIVLNRMKEFNERRYTHERVTDQRLIFVVSEGSMPRTVKGNIKYDILNEFISKLTRMPGL